jgi:RHS repeat-associated protein
LGNIISQYGHDGQLLYQSDERKGKGIEHVYLGGSLVATRELPWAGGSITKYQHTDALGSPVAVSNEAGQVIDRTAWEPYGAAIGKPAYSGAGYTGHVMDGLTGLTYMQQRYYDPAIGRFLSVDPVTANSSTGANFNRYWYANNNPYKFVDPDGRKSICKSENSCTIIQVASRGPIGNMRGMPRGGNSGGSDRKGSEGSGKYTSPTGKGVRGCDGYGCGHDGARRDGGRRSHAGNDYIAEPGQPVVSPTDGSVVRPSNPYRNDPSYTGLLIRGADGNTLQLWYLTPLLGIVGDAVVRGQEIGTAQNLQDKYGPGMTNHIHLRITDPSGANINPSTLIPDP